MCTGNKFISNDLYLAFCCRFKTLNIHVKTQLRLKDIIKWLCTRKWINLSVDFILYFQVLLFCIASAIYLYFFRWVVLFHGNNLSSERERERERERGEREITCDGYCRKCVGGLSWYLALWVCIVLRRKKLTWQMSGFQVFSGQKHLKHASSEVHDRWR